MKTGKAVPKQEKDVQKHVAYTLNFTYTKSKCMQKVFCVNQPKKHNASIDPQKVRQMPCTKLKCVKNHPPKMRQKSSPK